MSREMEGLQADSAVPMNFHVSGGAVSGDMNTGHMRVTPAFDVVKTGRYVEDDAQIVAYGEGDVIEPDTELYVKFRDPWGVVGPWERVYSKNQLNTFGIPSEVLTDPNA